jgi:8-oxo-dGTP diphosphatase
MTTSESNPLPLAVCAAVIEDQGKILLTERPANKQQGGFWEFPGGKIDPGESPHQSLKRELREELDIEISVGPVLETVYHHYDWGCVLIIAYLCRWEAGEIKHLDVANHSWSAPGQLEQHKLLPADQPILDKILSMPQHRQQTTVRHQS